MSLRHYIEKTAEDPQQKLNREVRQRQAQQFKDQQQISNTRFEPDPETLKRGSAAVKRMKDLGFTPGNIANRDSEKFVNFVKTKGESVGLNPKQWKPTAVAMKDAWLWHRYNDAVQKDPTKAGWSLDKFEPTTKSEKPWYLTQEYYDEKVKDATDAVLFDALKNKVIPGADAAAKKAQPMADAYNQYKGWKPVIDWFSKNKGLVGAAAVGIPAILMMMMMRRGGQQQGGGMTPAQMQQMMAMMQMQNRGVNPVFHANQHRG